MFLPVDLAVGPDGNLWYLNLASDFSFPSGSLHRIVYLGAGNHPPRPVLQVSTASGYAPLQSSFSGESSTDIDLDPLTYH
jgi:hypothetical protein